MKIDIGVVYRGSRYVVSGEWEPKKCGCVDRCPEDCCPGEGGYFSDISLVIDEITGEIVEDFFDYRNIVDIAESNVIEIYG